MFLGQTFVKSAENNTRTLFERPKSDKNWKLGKCRNPRKKRKSGLFGIQNGKTQPFFKKATWNFVHLFIGKCSYTCRYSLFWKLKNFLAKMGKWWSFSPIFTIFKKFKIWDTNLIAMFNLHVCCNPIGSFLKTVLVTIPAHPYFLPKSGEHDGTLTSFPDDVSEPWKIPLIRVCKFDAGRAMQSLVAISYFVFFFSYGKKSGGAGGVSPPPPPPP